MFDQGRGFVSLREKYVKILSGMLPAGAVGMSLLLGSTTPSVASEHPTASQPSASSMPLPSHPERGSYPGSVIRSQ